MAAVDQIFFVATHAAATRDAADRIILQANVHHFARSHPTTRLWMLLCDDDATHLETWLDPATGVNASRWGRPALALAFPRLETALKTHSAFRGRYNLSVGGRASAAQEANFRRYYFFHASLLLWLNVHVHAFPASKVLSDV